MSRGSEFEQEQRKLSHESIDNWTDILVNKVKPGVSTKNTIIAVSLICALIAIIGGITIAYLTSIDSRVITNGEEINELSKEILLSENRQSEKQHQISIQIIELENNMMQELKNSKEHGN